MAKQRLQDVASSIGVPVSEIRKFLKEWGIDKNNFATLEEEELQMIYDHFGSAKNSQKTQAKEQPPQKKPQKPQPQPQKPAVNSKQEQKPQNQQPPKPKIPKPAPPTVNIPPPTQVKEREPERSTKPKKDEQQILKKLQQQTTKKEKSQQEQSQEIKIVEIPPILTVRELSELISIPPNQVMTELLKRGILATINQNIDPQVALEIAQSFGFLAEIKQEKDEEEQIDKPSEGKEPRPPIVVVMGHVDHGKTTLLDTIRKTRFAQKEKGGITQHIGASTVELSGKGKITFLDTPGHEAFTTLRARGAQVTDIAILVVAADDGVMPQTIEAINHAKAFNVPIIVAVNKIDKPEADPQRVRRELSEKGLIPEEWGGDTIFVDVSAKTGQNIETLLEYILILAELLELKANPDSLARGTVIESKLDRQRGPTVSLIVQDGTLRVGDAVVAGSAFGRIRAMFDDKGKAIKSAGPSIPVEVLGFEELPNAGDQIRVFKDEREARAIAEQRKLKKELSQKVSKGLVLEEVFKRIQEGKSKELRLILKADTIGSIEALKKSFAELSNDQVSIRIIHSDVGSISENDVMLAKASEGIIIGFNVRPDLKAREAAEQEGVDVRLYSIIYEAIEDVKKALTGMLKPVQKEVFHGSAQVRATFKIKGVGTVAGCYITDGKILRNARARLVRDGVVIFEGKVESLKHFKEDVNELSKGFECGIKLKDFNDVKVGDSIECYEMKLEQAQL
ncbi:MAG: translation initiation factor IF-2 [Aquificaceae bacterium]|nr:translation initiation factor IF-2 [Aquificaceae bacterium]MDW8236949.1 translation initiation factor IF-2 [Aquificaceae bacterium]